MGAVTGKNKTFIIIFATKSVIIARDSCDTLEWIIVVAVHHQVVSDTKPDKTLSHRLRQSQNQGRRRKSLAPLSAPTLQQTSKIERETASVTPVRGPRSMELGSGKVAGKVLIVDHM